MKKPLTVGRKLGLTRYELQKRIRIAEQASDRSTVKRLRKIKAYLKARALRGKPKGAQMEILKEARRAHRLSWEKEYLKVYLKKSEKLKHRKTIVTRAGRTWRANQGRKWMQNYFGRPEIRARRAVYMQKYRTTPTGARVMKKAQKKYRRSIRELEQRSQRGTEIVGLLPDRSADVKKFMEHVNWSTAREREYGALSERELSIRIAIARKFAEMPSKAWTRREIGQVFGKNISVARALDSLADDGSLEKIGKSVSVQYFISPDFNTRATRR